MGAQDQPLCREQPGGAPTLTPVSTLWLICGQQEHGPSKALTAQQLPTQVQGKDPGGGAQALPPRGLPDGLGWGTQSKDSKGPQGLSGLSQDPHPAQDLRVTASSKSKALPTPWRPDQGRGSPLTDPALWKTRLLLVSSGWGAGGEMGRERAPTGLQCPCSHPSPVLTLLQER